MGVYGALHVSVAEEGMRRRTMRVTSLLVVLIAATTYGCSSPTPEQTAPPPTTAASAPVAAEKDTSFEELIAPQPHPMDAVEFKAALDLQQTSGAQPELRHGRVAVSK